jgi:hypothetical protein
MSGGYRFFLCGFLCFPVHSSTKSCCLRFDLPGFSNIQQNFVKNLSAFLLHPATEIIYPVMQTFHPGTETFHPVTQTIFSVTEMMHPETQTFHLAILSGILTDAPKNSKKCHVISCFFVFILSITN